MVRDHIYFSILGENQSTFLETRHVEFDELIRRWKKNNNNLPICNRLLKIIHGTMNNRVVHYTLVRKIRNYYPGRKKKAKRLILIMEVYCIALQSCFLFFVLFFWPGCGGNFWGTPSVSLGDCGLWKSSKHRWLFYSSFLILCLLWIKSFPINKDTQRVC